MECLVCKEIISLRTAVRDGLGCYATSRDYIAARSAEANRSQCIVQLVMNKKAPRKECFDCKKLSL